MKRTVLQKRMNKPVPAFRIREAKSDEYEVLGKLMADVYGALPGFPGRAKMPAYYEMLDSIGNQLENPGTLLIVAVSETGALLGGVVYFGDLRYYGTAGSITNVKNASGFRLLAVSPSARGMGIGRALVRDCIQKAMEKGHTQVAIHTTKSMQQAWAMYERMGFKPAPDLDFTTHGMHVYGFRLLL